MTKKNLALEISDEVHDDIRRIAIAGGSMTAPPINACICGRPAKAWLVHAGRYICDGCTFSTNGETSIPVGSSATAPWVLRCFVARVMMRDVGTDSPDINAAVTRMVEMTDDDLVKMFIDAEKPKEEGASNNG